MLLHGQESFQLKIAAFKKRCNHELFAQESLQSLVVMSRSRSGHDSIRIKISITSNRYFFRIALQCLRRNNNKALIRNGSMDIPNDNCHTHFL